MNDIIKHIKGSEEDLKKKALGKKSIQDILNQLTADENALNKLKGKTMEELNAFFRETIAGQGGSIIEKVLKEEGLSLPEIEKMAKEGKMSTDELKKKLFDAVVDIAVPLIYEEINKDS